MSDVAIQVNGLGKRFRLGGVTRHNTLRDVLSAKFRRGASAPEQDVWALKELSFEIKHGTATGIIGRNGAGKSTLLKVLSRIMEPTTGRAEIHGRVGALLEVGTGFHPELSGRENILLNGAILGMKRAEILRKFDEIVAFAEVERFIDTPVKHYSSGMYLRLAFAVAAHLEPDILFVDEVLAVGDASFQRKCLGKMGSAAYEGRTVLFVSHNLGAMKALCKDAILLRNGRIEYHGSSQEAINRYLSRADAGSDARGNFQERRGDGRIRFTSVEIVDHVGQVSDVLQTGESARFRLTYEHATDSGPSSSLVCYLHISANTGERLFALTTRSTRQRPDALPTSGCLECVVPRLPLLPGQYVIDVGLKDHVAAEVDVVHGVRSFTIIHGDYFGSGHLPPVSAGPFLVDHSWKLG